MLIKYVILLWSLLYFVCFIMYTITLVYWRNLKVEDVCVRASQVAEAAKDRLCVMKEDLNIHCRVKVSWFLICSDIMNIVIDY